MNTSRHEARCCLIAHRLSLMQGLHPWMEVGGGTAPSTPAAVSCSSSHLPVTEEPVAQPRGWATMAAVLGFMVLEVQQ